MFLLGHSCWSYLLSKATGRVVRISMPAYLALLAGVLPDFDIYFRPYVVHHTWTHSLLFLGPIAIVLVYKYRLFGLALSAGLFSHLLTDYLVGTVPLLYPVYPNFLPGLNLGIPSFADTVLEVGALGGVLLYASRNRDYKLLLKPSRESLLLAVPLVAIVTLTLLFVGDNNIPLAEFAFSRRALTLITLGHVLLVSILGFAVLRSLIPTLKARHSRTSPSVLR